MKTDIEKKLKELGYTSEWLQFGFINEQKLFDQIREIQVSEDKNPEHYRWKSYLEFLKGKVILTDQEVRNILKLQDADDCDLSEIRIIHLMNTGLLNDIQFKSIEKDPIIKSEPVRKIYTRHTILRALKKTGLTNELFEEIKKCKDKVVQEDTLNVKNIEIDQLEWFVEYGLNKKIRNVAKVIKTQKGKIKK